MVLFVDAIPSWQNLIISEKDFEVQPAACMKAGLE